MDHTFRKRVRKYYQTKEMQTSEIKVKKFAQDSQIDVIMNEKNNSSSESDIFQERRNTPFVSVYTDPDFSDDPLHLQSDSQEDSQTRVNSDRDVSESDVEDSEKGNEQEAVDPKELEDIRLIKQWIIHCKIPLEHADKLLKILKARLLPSIPLCAETLLKSNEPDFTDNHNGVRSSFSNDKELDIGVPQIDASNVQCKTDFEAFVLAQLVSQQSSMQRIENKLENFANFFMDKKVCPPKKSDIDFKAKYNLSFPINEKHLFMIFDEMLKVDKFLENDVCIELNNCVDKANYSISKSYLSMIRTFMTKNVAIQYTASRPSKEKNAKDIFKSTKFYECMEGVFLAARNKTCLTTTNTELMSSLSDVLSNAKKWNEKNK